jgi:hypothetical protein
VDVAVVGGGIAGIYVAARLAGDGRRSPVLFEATSRIGGRLWSQPLPEVPGGVAELGGMRIPEEHTADTVLRQSVYLTDDPDSPALLLAAYAYGDIPAVLLAWVAPEAIPGQPVALADGAATMLTEALSEVHGIPVPPPIGGAVQRWAELSGGAVPLWGPGQPPGSLAPR